MTSIKIMIALWVIWMMITAYYRPNLAEDGEFFETIYIILRSMWTTQVTWVLIRIFLNLRSDKEQYKKK